MACSFKLPFTSPVTEAVERAKNAVESQNGIFKGDTQSGDFEVSILGNFIKGNYQIEGQILNLEVTQKPAFVPCGMIENFLKKEIY